MELQTELDEKALVNALKQRDPSAFGTLYERYSYSLYKIIHQKVPNEDISEDILQKVFMNIWEKIEGYEHSRGKLYTWMANIARNAAIDTLRSKDYKTRQRQTFHSDMHNLHYPAGKTYIQIDGIGLNKYILKLKPQHQQLIDLVYYKGYSHPEVATMQAIPLSTIKTRVRSALMQLRSLMDK